MVLVSEVDGLRVITEATHMLLRRVADSLLQVGGRGRAGLMLY